MFDSLQLLCVGTAAVIDTVLLLALLERRNWSHVRAPILLVVVGAWLWHGSLFIRVLMTAPTGLWPDWLQWSSLMVLSCGLLLMPSAMLHGMLRLRHAGLAAPPRSEPWTLLAYLPMLCLVPIGLWLAGQPQGEFLEVVSPLVLPYIIWLSVANVIAAAGFLRWRTRAAQPRARQFFTAMAAILLGMAALHLFVFVVARPLWPDWESYWILLVVMLPVAPALLFTYFVTRYHFMKLVLERTLVYGGIVVCVLLYHRVAWQGVSNVVAERLPVDLVILECLVGIVLILSYQPLRQRTSEALRYFFGSRVARLREETRRLAGQLSAMSGQPPGEVLGWFTDQARAALDVEYVAAWLLGDAHGKEGIVARRGETARLPDERVASLHDSLRRSTTVLCTWREAPDQAALEDLQNAEAALAVRLAHPGVHGLLLFGRRNRGHEFGEEEVNAVALLAEQLGATLNSGRLQAERLAAERRALQSEKLSALGLLAGSVAHEVKNPLSSIKTIATVLTEELTAAGRQTEDLRLILGEVDRLSATVSQLLEFARPGQAGQACGDVQEALNGTVQVMRHLARQRGVAIETQVADGLPAVRADAAALREIWFNLLSNSIDAAGPGGCVSVTCLPVNGHVVAEVRDTGPGMSPEVQDRVFEPFFTTKPEGTGLGLYVVGRRVRELGGEIHCDSDPGRGTRFTLKLPCGEP